MGINAINSLAILGPWKDVATDLFYDFSYVISTPPWRQRRFALGILYEDYVASLRRERIALAALLASIRADAIDEYSQQMRALTIQSLARLDNMIANENEPLHNQLQELNQLHNQRMDEIQHRSYSYLRGNIHTLLSILIIYFIAWSIFPIMLIITLTPVVISLSLRSIIFYKCSFRQNQAPAVNVN